MIGAENKGSKPRPVRVRDSARRKGKSFSEPFQLTQFAKFTGCSPQLGTAVLYASRDEASPDPPLAGVAWRISGKYHHRSKLHDSCSATFEPFDGKLLVAADELNRSPCCQ